MDRRSFLKLAGASPALVSPVHVGRSRSHTGNTASETVIGSQTLAPPTGFTFYSPLAEAWYRAGEYFEWTSTTRNNEGRRVQVFYRTVGSRANPALVILHGYPTSSFDFQAMIGNHIWYNYLDSGRWRAATGSCRPLATTCNGTSPKRWPASFAAAWREGSRRPKTRTRLCGPWLRTGPLAARGRRADS